MSLSLRLSLLVAFALVGCSANAVEDDASTSDDQNITSSDGAVSPEDAVARVRALLPEAVYAADSSLGGFGCGINIRQFGDSKTRVNVNIGFYRGMFCPDCATSPAGGFEFTIDGDKNTITEWKDDDKAVSFKLDDEGTKSTIKLSDATVSGGAIDITFQRPGAEASTFQCTSLKAIP